MDRLGNLLVSRKVVTGILVCVALVAWIYAPQAGANPLRAETPRKLYISATDASGAPVTDLTAADVNVKEDGKPREIAGLKHATEKMDVHLFVDDSGTGAFQQGVLDLLQALQDHAIFTIYQFTPQAVKILDASSDFSALQEALNKLGRRGKVDMDGEQLAEALGTTARAIQQGKPARPVIIVMTLNGDSGHKNPDIIMSQIRRSGAVVSGIYLQTAGIGQVLGDSPRESGGRIERIGSVNAISPAVKKVVDLLLNAYELTYTLPDGVKPSDRVSVTTTKSGVTLVAPTRIPDR
jgi:ribosomal protein S16